MDGFVQQKRGLSQYMNQWLNGFMRIRQTGIFMRTRPSLYLIGHTIRSEQRNGSIVPLRERSFI